MAEGEVLHVDVSVAGGVATVVMAGELDVFSRRLLRDGVEEAVRSGASRVIVDMAEVSFIDGSGMRALVQSSARVRGAGLEFAVRSPSSAVVRMGRLIDLDEDVLHLR